MLKQKIISVEELSKFGQVANLNEQAFALVKQQMKTWGLARENYKALSEVQTRDFDFGHFKIIAQHNPGRIRSSTAKVNVKSISERPCFLCPNNLPEEQKPLIFKDKFLILSNPFPVFPVHLTIPLIDHKPQEIYHFFPDMLELSRELEGFTVFYNGPQCGASAPDHFHFQAGNRGFLPIENELENLEKNHSEVHVHKRGLKIFAVKNYLRRFVCIVSSDRTETINAFHNVYSSLPGKNGNEPMLNILCFYKIGEWRIIIFPRKRLRPSHFFRPDEKQIVVSPAAVELGGVLVLPVGKDFEVISNDIISEIYDEVTLSLSHFEQWINYFMNAYR